MSRGEYLHFRCEKHTVEGHAVAGNLAVYRCGVKGCDRPAKAFWYRGEQFQNLKIPALLGALDFFVC